MIVDGFLPVRGGVALEDFFEGAALHVGGGWDAGEIEEGRAEIEVLDEVLVDRAWFDDAGQPGHKRHSQGVFVHEAFVKPAMIAQVEALIGGIDDEGVFA